MQLFAEHNHCLMVLFYYKVNGRPNFQIKFSLIEFSLIRYYSNLIEYVFFNIY